MNSDLISRSAFISWLDVGHLRSPSEKYLSELDVKRMIELQPSIQTQHRDLISRSALLGRVIRVLFQYGQYEHEDEQTEDVVMVSDIMDSTSISERTAVWKLHGNDDNDGCSYFCSACNFSLDEDLFYSAYDCGKWIENHVFKFCPNCGAQMILTGGEAYS